MPTSDHVLQLQLKLAKLLCQVLLDLANPDTAWPPDHVLEYRSSPSNYLRLLAWVCDVLGDFDSIDICDHVLTLMRCTPTTSQHFARDWAATQRAGAAAPPSPHTVPSSAFITAATSDFIVEQLKKLQQRIQRHQHSLAELDHHEVAASAAVRLDDLRKLRNARELATKFVSLHANLADELRTLEAAAKWSQMQLKAHRLKGATRLIGARHCSETAEALEMAAVKQMSRLQDDTADHVPIIRLLLERLGEGGGRVDLDVERDPHVYTCKGQSDAHVHACKGCMFEHAMHIP